MKVTTKILAALLPLLAMDAHARCVPGARGFVEGLSVNVGDNQKPSFTFERDPSNWITVGAKVGTATGDAMYAALLLAKSLYITVETKKCNGDKEVTQIDVDPPL